MYLIHSKIGQFSYGLLELIVDFTSISHVGTHIAALNTDRKLFNSKI